MQMFRKIDDHFLAAPQIAMSDIAEAKAIGITTIINNRPDGEEDFIKIAIIAFYKYRIFVYR